MRPERRRRWWSTVRVRITALATLAVAAVLVAASVLLLARQRAGLVEALDESAAADAAQVAAAVEEGGPIPSFDADERVVVVIGPDGRPLEGSTDHDELVGDATSTTMTTTTPPTSPSTVGSTGSRRRRTTGPTARGSSTSPHRWRTSTRASPSCGRRCW